MNIILNDYIVRLEEFFTARFDGTWLPSHNLDHHRRVWNNALSLTKELKQHSFYFADDFMLSLLIVSYTHDIGMSVNQSEKHGEESKKLCAEFLLKEDVPSQLHSEILFAVENHDNKSYNAPYPPDSLLSILSVADDMDAFGYSGIYRYTEIYLARGMKYSAIAHAASTNAIARYKNLEKTFGFMEAFCNLQRSRLETLLTCFNDDGPFPAVSLERIISTIDIKLLKERKDISSISNELINDNDPFIALFFSSLLNELTIHS